jgi:hypothetical protein
LQAATRILALFASNLGAAQRFHRCWHFQ